MTSVGLNPWWAVDLGSVQAIASITITQASALTGSLAGFQVYVGNANTSYNDTANFLCPNPYADSEYSSCESLHVCLKLVFVL